RAARQAAVRRRLPLPRRAALPRGGRHHRRHRRRGPKGRVRRCRDPSEEARRRSMTANGRDDLANLFGTGVPPTDPELAALRGGLAAEAEARGLLDVAYRTLETPVGRLLLAATPAGLIRIAYEREGFDAVLASLAARVSPRILAAPGRLDDAAGQLD